MMLDDGELGILDFQDGATIRHPRLGLVAEGLLLYEADFSILSLTG